MYTFHADDAQLSLCSMVALERLETTRMRHAITQNEFV